jgi:3-oxoadipate enol-lactonase
MPFVKSNGIKLYYEVHGEGVPIVFAHGRGGSHVSWWQQVPSLSRRFQVVTFDHRGFGQSVDEPGGPGRAAYADDLRNLLDHLSIDSAHLVGQ